MTHEIKKTDEDRKAVSLQDAEAVSGTDGSLADSAKVTDTAPKLTPGDGLRMAREEMGLSIIDLAKSTLIRANMIEKLEAMNVADVERVYLIGNLKNLGDALGMKTQKLTEDYLAVLGAEAPVQPVEPEVTPAEPKSASKVFAPKTRPKPEPRRTSLMAVIGTGLAAVAAIGVIVWGLTAGEPVTPATAKSVLTVNTPQNGANESLFAEIDTADTTKVTDLTLAALDTGWIEVRGADGTIFRSRNMAAGETYHPRLGAGWTVTARDGGAFEWRVGDMAVGALGEAGQPVYAVNVDLIARDAEKVLQPQMVGKAGETQSTR